MYNCIVFDVDGTLIDTERAVFSSYQKVIFEEFGRYYEPEEIKPAFGVPTPEALARLGFKNIEEAEGKYHRYLMEAFCHAKPFEGIIEVLAALKHQGITTGVVTSRNKAEVEEDACFQGLAQYFTYVICADDTEKHKPDPEPLLTVVKRAEKELCKTLFIGDTHYDSACAKGAGVDFALALWGAKEGDRIGADYYLQEPRKILDVLKGSV